jgi:hypothetical protein
MGHDCPDQAAADACCARAEQAQQQIDTAASTYVPIPTHIAVMPIVLPHAMWTARQAAASAFERAIQQHPHSPPLLLSSVLLI